VAEEKMKNDLKLLWKKQRLKKAFLALEDGTVFAGYSVGADKDTLGEVVFNTGMTGYQEILSDPSYCGQIVTMTYPQIGNTGMNDEDYESSRLFVNGLIVCEIHQSSNWRCRDELHEILVKGSVPAIAGIDTRALTTLLRDKGSQKAYMSVEEKISVEDAVNAARKWEGLEGQDYAVRVSCKKSYYWDPDLKLTRVWGNSADILPADIKIVAFDFGVKWNILRNLRYCGMDITVVPATTTAEEVLKLKPDGVFLSNGPADPAALKYAIKETKELIGKIPIMGICLGHQILGIAMGGKTYKLKFGHHGCNHPVKNLATEKVEITSQNHNFAIMPDSLDLSIVEITHINLNDHTIEGIRHKKEPVFAVQYHPEAAPGPHDPSYLFMQFREIIKSA